jgi:hypothetical protein
VKNLAALLASALLTAAAIAGVTTSPKDGDYVLHNADNSIPAGFTKETARFKSKDLCVAAVKIGAEAGLLKPGVKCDTSVGFTFAQDCEGERPPKVYLSKEMQDGKDYWTCPAPRSRRTPSSNGEPLRARADVARGFPELLDTGRGAARRLATELQGRARQGIHGDLARPDMPPGDLVAEEPNDETPAGTPAGFQEEWDARQVAAAAACAAGDTKQCPQIPNQQPGACGDYRSAACGGPGV